MTIAQSLVDRDYEYLLLMTMVSHDWFLTKRNTSGYWYDKHELTRLSGFTNESRTVYWLNKLVDKGLVIRRIANLGHGYYWWYEYSVDYSKPPSL
jgi:hypothetical protein